MATTCKLIAKNVLGSDTATVTFSSIPGTFDDLYIVISARSSRTGSSADSALMSFNGSSSDFSTRFLGGSGTSATSGTTATGFTGPIPADDVTADTFSVNEIYIPNYAGAANKSYSATGSRPNNSSTLWNISATAGLWSQTTAISSIGFSLTTGPDFVTGSSFYLFGITKA